MIAPAVALGLALSLGLSAFGFKRVVYFVSLGYAASIAAQAIFIPLVYRDTVRGWVLIQSALLLAYGLRLGVFVTMRDRAASFQTEQANNVARGSKVRGPLKIAIWLSVSVLYVLMFLPALLSMAVQAAGQALPSVPMGVGLMMAGLGIETCADWQKTQAKRLAPSRFCDTGLFRVVRHPNYFGEMVFWFGVWISALSAYHGLLTWLLGSIGLVVITFIMLGSSRRLETKQTDRYGADPAYQVYAKTTPILFPFLPFYSLAHVRWLRG